ncbi:hypothetical protein FRC04_011245 [Tulasnella sp. 424]|nr:hypothetical protein FRC04_011245 [Tulasnella sp. 424]KAG8971773.1 hypothetical protein FRC05_010840 [Tulasnella sp. 425]
MPRLEVSAGDTGVLEGPGSVVMEGKRPLPLGQGRALGILITSDLHHASNVLQDSLLPHAMLRLLQRPLTVLITNLTQQITQLLLAPKFAPGVPLVLNATQVRALACAFFASELPRCSSVEELTPPLREPSPDSYLRRTVSEERLMAQPSDSSLSASSDKSDKTECAAQEKSPSWLVV